MHLIAFLNRPARPHLFCPSTNILQLPIVHDIFIHNPNTSSANMSLSNKLSITDVDLKDKRVLIRVSQALADSVLYD